MSFLSRHDKLSESMKLEIILVTFYAVEPSKIKGKIVVRKTDRELQLNLSALCHVAKSTLLYDVIVLSTVTFLHLAPF